MFLMQKKWKMTVVPDPTGLGREPGELPRSAGGEIDPQAENRKFLWFCNVVPYESAGTPKETSETKMARIQVNISASRWPAWTAESEDPVNDLAKIAFGIGKMALEKQMASGNVPEKATINAETAGYSPQRPIDPAHIRQPVLGAEFELAIQQRMGFSMASSD
jgi:hypothetical protein